jgi:hypothetical protein
MSHTPESIKQSIIDHGMIFLSAQPDSPYFHWQVELYLYQFSQHGILDRCYALFGYEKEPSDEAKRLQKKYPNVIFYKDERVDKLYAPGVRPHIYKKFFSDRPELGKYVFIHDSDIFLVKLPNFKMMLEDKLKRSYVSDTVNYIGYNYIKTCCDRYKSTHPKLPDMDLLYKMCKVIEIDPLVIKNREKQSGGAQYFYRDVDYKFWNEVEDANNKLYKLMTDYEKTYPTEKHIQKWTADMWGCLWVYWKRGDSTVVHDELEFSWATGNVDDYMTKPIFHLAGVTPNMRRVFYKGKYNNESVFEAYNKDRGIFNHISDKSATRCYVRVIEEYFNKFYAHEHDYLTDEAYFKTDIGIKSKSIKRDAFGKIKESFQSSSRPWLDRDRFNIIGCKKFKITCDDNYGNFDGEYMIDDKSKCCDKPIWRSVDSKYIIYHNESIWVATYAKCEKDIGKNGGGIASNPCEQPYFNDWNQDCLIDILCD